MIDVKAGTDTDSKVSFKCLYSQCVLELHSNKLIITQKQSV